MKKKNAFLLSIALLLCLAVIAGLYYLYTDIFPLAPPIFCPPESEIDSVSILTDEETSIALDSGETELLLLEISKAKATRKQSLDDTPSARPYYRISLKSAGIEYRYFVYQHLDQVYVEIPYSGVYFASDTVLEILQK
ncbi:MAG: DUF5301 domain-containing protein [Bacillota bacterium]|nr:DUF5301 domain-containing protein [Bacillota bacterium]